MASAPQAGGAGGDGSRDRKRWSESKVYTRKSHNKTPKQPAPIPIPIPIPPPPPPPPPLPSAAASDASSLNKAPNSHTNGHRRSVTISLAASRSPHEARELRRRLAAELEQVRSLSRKLEAREVQISSAAAGGGYANSQLSVSDPTTPATAKRPPPNTAVAPLRRPLSVAVPGADNSLTGSLEKEKRTPKANQYYRNSDFILGKEKLVQPGGGGGHKKSSKANGGKKHLLVDVNYAAAAGIVDVKVYAQAFKNCGALLAKLMKHKFGWVFNKPVDIEGLGLHDYLTIIKHPMDLGTVKSRINNNWYKSPGEFAEDVRLTFRNAMTYNAQGQDVYVMAEQLSKIFEEVWPAIEAECTYPSQPRPLPKKPPPIDVRNLERSDSTAHPVAADTKTRPPSHAAHVVRPTSLKKPKAKELYKRDMTFEEKQKLSNNLQNLPSEKLDSIVQIIKKRNLMMTQHDNEIEVDIDNVDTETLWELDRFVTNYKKSLSKNKKKAELAILARAKAEQHVREKVPGSTPEVRKESNTVVEKKDVASPVGGEKEEDNASRSSNSSSSSSGSGSSSSDSDSESSSGSDAAHSPKT